MIAKKIVIADDDRDLTRVLAIRCQSLGFHVRTAHDATTALRLIQDDPPDLVCLDVNMPHGNGLGVREMLSADKDLKSIPVIMLTGQCDVETVRRCHSLCAYYVPKGADFWQRVEPLIQELVDWEPIHAVDAFFDELAGNIGADKQNTVSAAAAPAPKLDAVLQETVVTPTTPVSIDAEPTQPVASSTDAEADDEAEPVAELAATPEEMQQHDVDEAPEFEEPRFEDGPRPRILCIDDDYDFTEALRLRLESHGATVFVAHDGMEGYRAAFMESIDVIIMDYSMPNGQGDYVLDRMKGNPVTNGIPILMLSGHKDKALERKVYNLGATRYFTKPIDFAALVKELRHHVEFPRTGRQLARV